MSDKPGRGDDSTMEPNPSSDSNTPHATNSRIRVAVWSPYKRLEKALQELLASLGDTESVELSQTLPFPHELRDRGVGIVVLDVDGSHKTARELIGEIRRSGDDLKVIAVSTHRDRQLVDFVLAAGAVGYVTKDCAFEELPSALRAVSQSQRYVSPTVDGAAGRKP